MESILTPSEMDALLAPQPDAGDQVKVVKPIDLISRDHQAFAILPKLREMTERLAFHLSWYFTQQFKVAAKVASDPVEIVPASRLTDLFGSLRFLFGVEINGRRGAGLFAADAVLGGCFVEHQFGGSITTAPRAEGVISSTEKRTAGRLADKMLETLKTSLQPLCPLEMRLEPDDHTLLKQTGRTSSVVIFAFHITFGEQTGTAYYALDTAAAGFKRIAQTQAPTIKRQPELIAPLLKKVRINASAVLGHAIIPVDKFLALQVGDLLQLDTPIDSEIVFFVEKSPKFQGVPTIHRGNLSLRISGPVKE